MNALKKGLIYIYIDNKVITALNLSVKKAVAIKIDGDQRLFTNILYSNEHGELLINLDHQGNHNDVIKFAVFVLPNIETSRLLLLSKP
ncbi:MAG: hypothetical protein O7C56_09935 [Rickettsia endosymbiont of Ixodes persulcatus]|nr:hypothetical protein [Rickettsia endosymbiont of Ixodes persulcatus]